MFFTFFKLYKWYQIAQSITYTWLSFERTLRYSHKMLSVFLLIFSGLLSWISVYWHLIPMSRVNQFLSKSENNGNPKDTFPFLAFGENRAIIHYFKVEPLKWIWNKILKFFVRWLEHFYWKFSKEGSNLYCLLYLQTLSTKISTGSIDKAKQTRRQ